MRRLLCGRGAFVLAWFALATASNAASALVAVHLEVRDEATSSGLTVSITKDVEPGTNALAFLESVISLEYRRYPGMGVFVTSVCGVAAPDGMFWALSVNGERATRGIADVTIDADMHLAWHLVAIR